MSALTSWPLSSPWPPLEGVVVVDRGALGAQLRWATSLGQVAVLDEDDVQLLERPDGTVAVLPLDDPEPDIAALVPEGVVTTMSFLGLTADVLIGPPPT